ncbi:MAG TPA: carboxymuconolactone decarboxylase family protein [Tissierellaceae bacterium]|nr:carboxymuconolactone decarboxylase family protein [Tissierellaceae bacterium]
MLAVTEVNGCEVCSYAHTKAALETGMSNNEIQNMLSGINDDIPSNELSGIIFAQHYADSRGKPSKEALKRIIDVYGQSKAEGIVAVVRIIMMGNAYGIPWSSFINRFKGKPDERCSLIYELSIIVSTIIFLPPALLQASFANISKIPYI